MYKGFANAVEVDFSIPENREKMLAMLHRLKRHSKKSAKIITTLAKVRV